MDTISDCQLNFLSIVILKWVHGYNMDVFVNGGDFDNAVGGSAIENNNNLIMTACSENTMLKPMGQAAS